METSSIAETGVKPRVINKGIKIKVDMCDSRITAPFHWPSSRMLESGLYPSSRNLEDFIWCD
jgi:hypothetical protein